MLETAYSNSMTTSCSLYAGLEKVLKYKIT